MIKPCVICGDPVEMTPDEGMPQHEQICPKVPCMKEWARRNGAVYMTMEEWYAATRGGDVKPSLN